MALPINIDDLINCRTVESERIEFKEGWNLEEVIRPLCAFANDIYKGVAAISWSESGMITAVRYCRRPASIRQASTGGLFCLFTQISWPNFHVSQ